ncbi:hypothetical protein M7775_15385 [Sporomusa sphaeroides DSM 2875]|uniref:hypothetical protein n=1 Tax=Sporomusa sphaeroides TaxID=47679 RepID=UPI00202E78D6|nr:hypothetical protein [Sporomusa sphaeroides]MCM0759940.1 hypothetical protein [Sporomusa sphaeroides DSM 2875]
MGKDIYDTAEKILLAMIEQKHILIHHYHQSPSHIASEEKLEEYNQFAIKQVTKVYKGIIEELKKIDG